MVSSKRDDAADADLDATQALNESVVNALEMCAIEESTSDESTAEAGWARRVGTRLAAQLQALDTQNVAAMLAAATDGGGAELAHHLDAGANSANALASRLAKYEGICRGAAGCGGRGAAARADAAARALLNELQGLYAVLDAPALHNLDDLAEINLGTTEGSARARAAADALISAFNSEKSLPQHLKRLAAVRERMKRLHRAKESLCACLARQLNNALIHAGAAPPAPAAAAPAPPAPPPHHAALAPHAVHMRTLKIMDRKAFDALVKVYTGTWCRLYGREVQTACEAARALPPPNPALTQVLALVEEVCNAEQEFCTQFFHLDEEFKEDGSDGDSGSAGGGSRGGGGAAGGGGGGRHIQRALFPALEAQLLALVATLDKADPYGCFVTFACISSRAVLPDAAEEPGPVSWSRGALAAAAVAAKRQADRAIQDRLANMAEQVKQAGRKTKCGVFPFIWELQSLAAACDSLFPRRSELDRWYHTLAAAMMEAIAAASHPRTPTHVLHMENYHALHSVVSSLRVWSLDALRRECKSRYSDALQAYVQQYTMTPLDKLSHFFEGVSEAIASGVREEEVCYRAAFSKHELRRVLALYPAQEVRKSLRRLYRTVERHVSEDGGLLQVVWRAMQEELVAHHVALQARIASCYPGAGLSLPLTTDDILQAFSDIAREH